MQCNSGTIYRMYGKIVISYMSIDFHQILIRTAIKNLSVCSLREFFATFKTVSGRGKGRVYECKMRVIIE